MNEISSIAMNVTPKGVNNLSKATNVVNFRANKSEEEQVDAFIKEQEKAKKKAERTQTFNSFVMGTIAAASLATLALMGHQMGWFKKFKLD